MSAIPVKHYEVFWYGPYEYNPDDDVQLPEIHLNNVLYMICGTHGLYGRNVPLYIGKTEQSIYNRIKQHLWLREEPDPVKIYTACIGEFVSWTKNLHIEEYPPLPTRIIEQVESLLIFAHQPVKNIKSKQGNNQFDSHMSLFNTGRRSTLYPEVSTLRWIGDKV